MVLSFEVPDGAEPGTWDWVIQSWKIDPYSRYNGVKKNTQEGYDETLKKISNTIGHLKIAALNYALLGEIRTTLDQKGRAASSQRKIFSMMSTLAHYAVGPLRQQTARDVIQDLSQIVIRSDAKWQKAPDREFVRAVIDEADARGLFAFATGILFQWTYMLRSVDVRGQWMTASQSEGGVYRNGKRWEDGLTWDMFDEDLTAFSKVISKTRRSLAASMDFELTPELRGRLMLLRNAKGGVGPVIISERYNEPYTRYSWSQAFRRIRDDLGLPNDVWMMDTRAGAITDAKAVVSDAFAIRDAAQHMHVDTTDGHARARSENINKVVKLRAKK